MDDVLGWLDGRDIAWGIGTNKVERFTLLKNPGIYLDPDGVPLPREGIAPWQRLLARCLAFTPAGRFPG
ncbi:MAG: hypothetical protein HGB14_09005, partial [Anaerolineaceae bacterium]|nr:hypothetical protein [Anaerolineaceae bacterium]